jgi:hypothetical protein
MVQNISALRSLPSMALPGMTGWALHRSAAAMSMATGVEGSQHALVGTRATSFSAVAVAIRRMSMTRVMWKQGLS